jgi:hypothetical protein
MKVKSISSSLRLPFSCLSAKKIFNPVLSGWGPTHINL